MTVSNTTTKLLTADDLLRLYGKGVRGELIRGVLCETIPTGFEHGKIVMDLGFLLASFVKPRKLGRLTASDSGVWLERDPDTVREAGRRLLLRREDAPGRPGHRLRPRRSPTWWWRWRPPATACERLNDKALMWLSYGVRLVWVVHPSTRTVDVYREGRPEATLTANDSLHGLDALPGFTSPVRDVFDP